jgi:hypothetical protein
MSKKAMQLALDYLTRLRTISQYENIDALYSAETTERLVVVAALEAALAAKAEPVAWFRRDQLQHLGSGFLMSASPNTLGRTDLVPIYAAPQLAIPAGWQPIETAPDDFVLVHEDGAMRALIHTNGKWKNPSYPALVSLAWGDVLVGDDAKHVLAPLGYRLELRDGCCENPTEWMALPEAPNPESKS